MAIKNDDSKEKLKSRLARAIGHLNAVYRMVDEEKYCIDVLHQLKAVQAALEKTSEVILKQHLQTCVVEAIQGQDSARVIEELMQVFKQAPTLYSSDEDASLDVANISTAANNLGKQESQTKSEQSGCCH